MKSKLNLAHCTKNGKKLKTKPSRSKNKCPESAEISDRVELRWKCLLTSRRPVVTRGDNYWSDV